MKTRTIAQMTYPRNQHELKMKSIWKMKTDNFFLNHNPKPVICRRRFELVKLGPPSTGQATKLQYLIISTYQVSINCL